LRTLALFFLVLSSAMGRDPSLEERGSMTAARRAG
jgi:hypothetical protein